MSNRNCSVIGCNKPVKGRGRCNTHYMQLLRSNRLNEQPRKNAPSQQLAEFVEKAAKSETDDCIIWPFGVKTDGYGQLTYNGKKWIASRLALSLATGVNPGNLITLHGPCHNKRCINPRHLRWGTDKENQLDRARDGTILRGSDNPFSKLTAKSVLAIREDSRPADEVAKSYQISRQSVERIRRRETWKWLPDGADTIRQPADEEGK